MKPAALIGLVFIMSSATVMAAPDGGVGFVGSYDGDPRAYFVEHAGTTSSPHFGLTLYAGDIVGLRNPTGSGRIFVAAPGAPQPIDRSTGPFTVQESDSILPAPLRNIVDEILSAVRQEPSSDVITPGPAPIYRGGDLAFRIEGLADKSALIAAGQRTFGIAWVGGTAPFHVTVAPSNGGGPILDYGDAKNPLTHNELLVRSHAIGFAPAKSFIVTITDAVKHQITTTITTVDSPPSPPVGVIPSFVQGDLRALLTAAWLAHQGPREYRYEAYLELLSLVAQDRLVEEAEAELRLLRRDRT